MSRLTSSVYDIARSAGACAASGRVLAPGERVVVALIERTDDGGLDRLDFAEEAWDAGARDPAGRRVFAHWRGVQPEPNAKPRQFIDDDSLLDLFHRLGESGSEGGDGKRRAAFRYVLALILCRKRLLVHEGSAPGALLVRARGSDPGSAPIRVEDPGLDESMLAAATEQVGAVLRAEG